MRLLLLTFAPLAAALGHAPRMVQALPDFRAAGHDVFLAAPVAGEPGTVRAALGAAGLLPLLPTGAGAWHRLAANSYRVAHWARRWRPDVYLSLGAGAGTLAHTGRGATGGYGLSVLVLPTLRYEAGYRVGQWLERRALHECDRIVTGDPALAARLVAEHGARGGDVTLLPSDDGGAAWVALCERLLEEPPGFP